MQKLLIIGHIGRDPELRYSQEGTVVARFSVANTERWRDRKASCKKARNGLLSKRSAGRPEIVGEFLHKGSRVYLEGRKRTESWEDKKTGGKNYRDPVYVDRLEFLDSRKNGNGNCQPDETDEEENALSEDVPL